MSPVRNLFHGSLFFVIVTYAQRESANEKLKRCCKAQESKFTNNQTAINVCLRAYCDFDSISQTNILVYLKHCDNRVVGTMFSCASSNVDHTKCCVDKGVSKKCLEYCSAQDGAPNNYVDYIFCVEEFNSIRDCFADFLEKHEPFAE
ncbi:unnamed protein product [Dracunculus medinensis]|uniref:DB domain-containing protein n=1 Tax=Dracunculus medinensis TaxID=318479 RepID=A0A0N4UNQ4_DRAME|nr:unnamed protein product [Dracunculus medinensis]